MTLKDWLDSHWRHCFTTTHHKTSQHKTSQRKIPRLTICSLGSRSKLPTPFDARCSCGYQEPLTFFASLKHLYLFTTSISADSVPSTKCQSQKRPKASPECLRSQAHTRPSDWCLHIHSMTSCSAQMLQLNAKQGKGWNVVQNIKTLSKFDQTIKTLNSSFSPWLGAHNFLLLPPFLPGQGNPPQKKVVHNNHESWGCSFVTEGDIFLQSTFLQFLIML